jgi:hypothetical protein
MTKKYITFKKAKTHYEVFYNDRVLIGELIAVDDGPYVFGAILIMAFGLLIFCEKLPIS